MKITPSRLLNVVLAGALISVLLFMASSANTIEPEYDPWEDLNGDGKIDIYDVVMLLNSYGSTGDPTRNVTITNWPLDDQGNLMVSLTDFLANKCLTVYLKCMQRVSNYETGYVILSNSTEVLIGGRDIVIVGGNVAGGASWSWMLESLEGTAATGGWSEAVAMVELYNSTGGIIETLSLPINSKIRIPNVYKIVITIEVPIPLLAYIQANQASYIASATATVFWIEG